jgi:hypothetical protein
MVTGAAGAGLAAARAARGRAPARPCGPGALASTAYAVPARRRPSPAARATRRRAFRAERCARSAVDVLVNAAGATGPLAPARTTRRRRILAPTPDGRVFPRLLPDMASRGWGRILFGRTGVLGPARDRSAGCHGRRPVAPRGKPRLRCLARRHREHHRPVLRPLAGRHRRSPSLAAGARGHPGASASWEFGHAVRFLVSPLAGYVTGSAAAGWGPAPGRHSGFLNWFNPGPRGS